MSVTLSFPARTIENLLALSQQLENIYNPLSVVSFSTLKSFVMFKYFVCTKLIVLMVSITKFFNLSDRVATMQFI